MDIKLTVIVNKFEKIYFTDKNENLLLILQRMNIYLPAICAGKGTCGKCKIKVVSGFLEVTKSDSYYFSNSDLELGYRLSCSAYPKEDITICIPDVDESKIEAITFYKPSENIINNIKVAEINIPKNRTSIVEKIKSEIKRPINSMDILKECSAIADNIMESAYVSYDENKIINISASPKDFYGLGIDIGTTTIAFGLVNLISGEVLGNFSVINKQREFGGDVISRILKANSGCLDVLSSSIKKQIVNSIKEICESHNININHLLKIAIAGNTTMIHLLLGLSCNTLGTYPFTPVTLELTCFNFKEIFDFNLSCTVEILPGLSAYVGADITSGILFSDIDKKNKPIFLLDIGTNGEMVVCVDGKIMCTATAAGPAFEGGNIVWGIGSVPGAISAVKYYDGNFQITTIGDNPPIGICGSGVIDAVSVCLQNNIINNSGRFSKEYTGKGAVLGTTPTGKEIILTQKDIRSLQLGKGAIRSGIECLLSFANLKYSDIEAIYIAGGFGYKINYVNAVGIGLIPEKLANKIVPIGNSALGGLIKYLLDYSNKERVLKIVSQAIELNLSEDKQFNKMFIDNVTVLKPMED